MRMSLLSAASKHPFSPLAIQVGQSALVPCALAQSDELWP